VNHRLDLSGVQDANSLLPTTKLDISQVFEAADANHDGRVTYAEAHSYNFLVTQSQFDSYDTDHNGYIDRAEAGLPPAEIKVADIFEAADTNNDEKLTFAEAYAYSPLITEAQFDTWDTNHDGVVDRTEAGLPPVDTGKGGCEGCGGTGKSLPAYGDLFTMALSLLGLAAMAKVSGR